MRNGFLPLALFVVIPAVVAAAVGRFAFLLLLLRMLPPVDDCNLFRMIFPVMIFAFLMLLRFTVAFATFDLAAIVLPPVVSGAVARWMASG